MTKFEDTLRCSAVEYRWLRGKDEDSLVATLNDEAKSGDWKVVAIIPRGQTYVAILHGRAYQKPPGVTAEPETPAERAIREQQEAFDRRNAELDQRS